MIQSVTIQNRGIGGIYAKGLSSDGVKLCAILGYKSRKCFVRNILVHPMKPTNIYYNDFMELFKAAVLAKLK